MAVAVAAHTYTKSSLIEDASTMLHWGVCFLALGYTRHEVNNIMLTGLADIVVQSINSKYHYLGTERVSFGTERQNA